MSLFKAFRERAAAFRNDDQGSIAVMFAVSFGMMIAFTGAAIDISRAVLAHSLLQQATDSAGLAAVNLARSEGSDLSSVDSFESTVGVFIVTNLEAALAEAAPLKMSAEYVVTIVNGELVITAKAPVTTSFARLLGVLEIDIGVRTVVSIPPASEPPDPERRAVLKG